MLLWGYSDTVMMLPTHTSSVPGGGSASPVCFPRLAAAAAARRPSFLANFCHRMGHLSLMDLQFSLAQFSLLLFAPRKVYAFAVLRKKQKNHYARDDPGFLLLLLLFSLLVGLAYGLAFSHSVCGCLLTALAPSVYLLLSGAVIAPLAYLLLLRSSNKSAGAVTHHRVIRKILSLAGGKGSSSSSSQSYAAQQERVTTRRDLYAQQQQPTRYFPLRLQPNATELVPAGGTAAACPDAAGAMQRGEGRADGGREKSAVPANSLLCGAPAVELFFCFDVHWNASFVYMVVGLVMQLFLFPVFTMLPEFLSCLLANGLQFAAAGSYIFITILGYVTVLATRQLPPVYSLLPPVAVAAALVVISTAFFHVNLAQVSVKFMLLFESITLRPVVRNAGIAHTLLQQEIVEFLSPNSSSNPLAGDPASGILEVISPANREVVQTETASATPAALSAVAGIGDAATGAAVPLTKLSEAPRVTAFPTSGTGLPPAAATSGS